MQSHHPTHTVSLQLRRRQNGARSCPIDVAQELMGRMLRVGRAGITEGTGHLQRAGAIRSSRSRIEVLDRACLEARACECYGLFKRESDRLLPQAATT